MHPQIQPHQESTQDVEAALQSFYSTKVATQEAMEKPWENRGFLEFVGFPQFEINEISRDFKKAQILFWLSLTNISLFNTVQEFQVYLESFEAAV